MADNREHTEALDPEALRELRYNATHFNSAMPDRGFWRALALLPDRAEVDRLHRQITALAQELNEKARDATCAAQEAHAIGWPSEEAVYARELQVLKFAARRVRALGQPAPQPAPDNQENTQ